MTRAFSFAALAAAAAALISTAAATPMPTRVQMQALLASPKMTTIVVQEALIVAQETSVPYVTTAPDVLPITIINRHTAAISTSHAYNSGVPMPVDGMPSPGTLAPNATFSMAVPTGWGGNVAVVDASHPPAWMGGDTLIEASFNVPYGSNGIAVGDIDISYVDGFSLPSTCWCDDAQTVLTGCNLDLLAVSTCPSENDLTADYGVCSNPLRSDLTATDSTDFFAPCKGLAYTFPSDDAGNSFGYCQNGITCCVGTACPPNLAQTQFP